MAQPTAKRVNLPSLEAQCNGLPQTKSPKLRYL